MTKKIKYFKKLIILSCVTALAQGGCGQKRSSTGGSSNGGTPQQVVECSAMDKATCHQNLDRCEFFEKKCLTIAGANALRVQQSNEENDARRKALEAQKLRLKQEKNKAKTALAKEKSDAQAAEQLKKINEELAKNEAALLNVKEEAKAQAEKLAKEAQAKTKVTPNTQQLPQQIITQVVNLQINRGNSTSPMNMDAYNNAMSTLDTLSKLSLEQQKNIFNDLLQKKGLLDELAQDATIRYIHDKTISAGIEGMIHKLTPQARLMMQMAQVLGQDFNSYLTDTFKNNARYGTQVLVSLSHSGLSDDKTQELKNEFIKPFLAIKTPPVKESKQMQSILNGKANKDYARILALNHNNDMAQNAAEDFRTLQDRNKFNFLYDLIANFPQFYNESWKVFLTQINSDGKLEGSLVSAYLTIQPNNDEAAKKGWSTIINFYKQNMPQEASNIFSPKYLN